MSQPSMHCVELITDLWHGDADLVINAGTGGLADYWVSSTAVHACVGPAVFMPLHQLLPFISAMPNDQSSHAHSVDMQM